MDILEHGAKRLRIYAEEWGSRIGEACVDLTRTRDCGLRRFVPYTVILSGANTARCSGNCVAIPLISFWARAWGMRLDSATRVAFPRGPLAR